ncbi:hypothetical protein GCM10008018_48090 [Paenibacillus marchantiophytorum]|uniref:Uncharacterized protein n=1 Tax=Paenibacillus marchantiophytorum TaxID=1619310 RepID=A0ABQ1F174_9BACL|nr:hypothetical protein GCM10008018_48090 [Paenibacillus marchantiophytorum]
MTNQPNLQQRGLPSIRWAFCLVIRVYMFWGERGVISAASMEAEGTTVRYSSKKSPYPEVQGTTVRYFAVS